MGTKHTQYVAKSVRDFLKTNLPGSIRTVEYEENTELRQPREYLAQLDVGRDTQRPVVYVYPVAAIHDDALSAQTNLDVSLVLRIVYETQRDGEKTDADGWHYGRAITDTVTPITWTDIEFIFLFTVEEPTPPLPYRGSDKLRNVDVRATASLRRERAV